MKNFVLMQHVVWSPVFSFLTQKKCSPEHSGSLRGLLQFWSKLMITDTGGWWTWRTHCLRQFGSFVYRFISSALSFLGSEVTAGMTQRKRRNKTKLDL